MNDVNNSRDAAASRQRWRLGHTPAATPTTLRPALRGRSSRRIGALTLVGALALGGALGTASAVSPAFTQQAQAATHGYGYDEGDGFLGQELVNGVATFCLEILASPPTGDSAFIGNQAWASMNADQNAQINQAVTEFGQLADNNWAAATHLFVWSLADSGEYNSHGMSGDDYYVERAPQSQRADILDKLAQIRAATAGTTAGTAGAGTATLDLQVDARNNYVGTLTVSAPAGMTGTVTLSNGVFTQNGSNVMAGVTNGMVLNVRGVPADGVVDYKIGAAATFDGQGGYAGQVGLYQTAGGAQQHTAGPGPLGNSHLEANAEDPGSRSTMFQPAVGTKVASVYVEKGQPFCDVVTFYTAEDENGRVNEWQKNPANGNYAPITATGKTFGPFNARPAEADTAPSNAPVFDDSMTVTTSVANGPAEDYTACTTNVAQESGYYTHQWSIDAADQLPAVTRYLPADYSFTDRFAQVVETSLVPSSVQFSSKMTSPQVGLGGQTTDNFTPSLHDGAWIIKDDGTRVPVVLTHTARYTSERPQVAATAPEGAEVVSTFQTTLTGPGAVETAPIDAGYRKGFINVQTCIVVEDQAAADQGMVDPWCDAFGLPDETFEVVGPDITTKAKPDYLPGEEVWDDVTVSGTLPKGGVDTIVYTYAQKPGVKTLDQLTAAGGAVCTVDNLVNTSAVVHYDEAGTQRSMPFTTSNVKDVILAHIEVSVIPGTDIEISRGKCGETPEMTLPRQPKPEVPPGALASTGAGGTTPLLIGGGVLLAAGLVLAAIRLRARKSTAVESTNE